tara:strand:+ start:976 stop:1713 length:738 start_codon:yes stop_codon:yes gene_type:complete
MASAAVIAEYNFNDTGGDPYADVANASGLDAGNITPGAQMDAGDSIPTTYSSEGAGSYAIAGANVNAGSNSTSTAWDNAQTDGLYFEFTLTPDGGQTLNLTNLQLDVAYRGTDAFRLAVTSSLTGFDYGDQLTITTENVNDAASIPNILQSNLDGIDLAPLGLNGDWGAGAGTIIDLSSATFDNISSAVTFRIYGFQAQTSSDSNDALFFDNIQVNGAVIPEPASAALILSGCAGMLLMRRRRRA